MSLISAIVEKATNSSMGMSRPLSKITSTTMAETGYSLQSIRKSTFDAGNAAIPADAAARLGTPISSMTNYVMSRVVDPNTRIAVSNAAVNSNNYAQALFDVETPGAQNTLLDLQTAGLAAVTGGVSQMGSNLTAINGVPPDVIQGALSTGNAALVGIANSVDTVCTNIYQACQNAVSSSVSAISTAVVGRVQALNNTAGTIAEAFPVDMGPVPVLDTLTNTRYDANPGVYIGKEGEPNYVGETTDVTFQDIKLFIEGVQVPFESISITQAVGQLPSAMVQIPPHPGLMDIVRNYHPKVHVFYEDPTYGGERLLFWGIIIATNFTRSRQEGRASVSFECIHKNYVLESLSLDYSGYAENSQGNVIDSNPDQAALKVSQFNSQLSVIMSLQGLTGVQSDPKDFIGLGNADVIDADITKLGKRFEAFESRYKGMPSVVMNLWNQIKRDCYVNPKFWTIMTSMYIPLVEEGIHFFDRLAGHSYLESQIEGSRSPYCPGGVTPESVKHDVMVPPAFRLENMSAVQTSMAANAAFNAIGFSGELTNFFSLINEFFYSIEYEIVTLASPAEVPVEADVIINPDAPDSSVGIEKMAIETIVKPQMPFYYSPLCNVLFPRMFHSLSMSQVDGRVPTRITAFHDVAPNSGMSLGSTYRAPASVRESVALGLGLNVANQEPNLQGTTSSSFNVPGKYEQGRGVFPTKIALPNWLTHFIKGKIEELGSTNVEAWPSVDSVEYRNLVKLNTAWVDRFGYDVRQFDDYRERFRNPDKDALNPYSHTANIHPFQRLLFAAVDYQFTKEVVQARSGSVDGIFNPYIVPGYPLDILDDSPNAPSYHGWCTSVTHSISSRSISTSIGVVGAATYTELSHYYMQPLHPWIATALDIVNISGGQQAEGTQQYAGAMEGAVVNSTLINNPVAKTAADNFYRSVLGVGSAGVEEIYNFQFGRVIPVNRANGILVPGNEDHIPTGNGGEANPYMTGLGSLALTARPIEGRKAIEAKFGVRFIDLSPENYSGTTVAYLNPVMSEDYLLEPGASLFLDYEETQTFIEGSF